MDAPQTLRIVAAAEVCAAAAAAAVEGDAEQVWERPVRRSAIILGCAVSMDGGTMWSRTSLCIGARNAAAGGHPCSYYCYSL